MDIVVNYDQSVSSLPSGFTAAVQYVASLYDSIFTNNVTLNINVGYDEVDGIPMSGTNGTGAVGNSYQPYVAYTNYSTVAGQLEANSVPATSLPSVDPTTYGQTVQMSLAEAQALGFGNTTSQAFPDGYVGFSSTQPFYDGTTGTPSAGYYDLVATVEHEFSEIMGRTANGPAGGQLTALDLYSYTSPGVLVPAGTAGSYFSTNRGQTNLGAFNAPAITGGGDNADWAPGGVVDAFNAFGTTGVAPPLSASDIAVMKALGWTTSVVGTGSDITGNGENDLISQSSNGTLTVEQLNANGTVGGNVQAGNNTITLSSADAGATVNLNGATVVLGSGTSAAVSGISNTVNVGDYSAATVSGTGDTVNAGTGDGIGLVGSYNNLTAGAYTTAVDYGYEDTVTVGSNSNLTVFGNGSHDNAYGVGSTVALAGNGSQTTVGNGSVILISGNHNLVGAGGGDTIAISGASNQVYASSNTLALDVGNANTITAGASSAITNIGSNGTDSAGSGSTFLVSGASNVFLVNPSSAYVLGSAGPGGLTGIDTLKGTIANFSGDLINGLASGMHIDVTDLIPSGVTPAFTGSASAGVLTLASVSQYFAVSTYGAINPGSLHVSNDGNNGTLLTYS